MPIFTLAISCLTTSNLPWFMDLTFQVPMQYCSLQNQTLLPSPVRSTAGCCFCCCSISSFFLELFLHWSPVAYWAPTNLGSYLPMSYLFAFSYCSWGSQGKNAEVVCYSLLQWNFVKQRLRSPGASGCEEIPHIQGQRRSPRKTVGGAKLHLESNPIPTNSVRGFSFLHTLSSIYCL